MKYDDASWHYGGDFPDNLPEENGATHIGMFLAWCIENDLISEELKEDAQDEIAQVKDQKITGATFLIQVCDEKLNDSDLNDEGNAFALDYYEDNSDFAVEVATYMNDFSDALDKDELESFYEVEDSFENYQIIKEVLDKRFKEWQQFKK